MVSWIAMMLDARLDTHDRVASIGADDESRTITNLVAIAAKTYLWGSSHRDLDASDIAEQVRSTRDRFGIQQIAYIGMPHAERRLKSGTLKGGQIQSLRLREFCVDVVAE
jgi:hypothetical protein